jgi:LAO/AO transport system kinase
LADAKGGDQLSLARLLSVVERLDEQAEEASQAAGPVPLSVQVIGITGSPGAGKSTLVNQLVKKALGSFGKVAVLAVDPSSPFSGGALLGDRVRMVDHALDDRVFIRSLASRGVTGGLSAAVPLATRVLAAAGFEVILVETVGVGQVEVDVVSLADTVVVVLTPLFGDSIQAAKAGLMEIGDVFVVNKADSGEADRSVREVKSMLSLTHHEGWLPPVVKTVASTGEGVDALWDKVREHFSFLSSSGLLASSRAERALAELERHFTRAALTRLRDELRNGRLEDLRRKVHDGLIDPLAGARLALEELRRP